MIARVSRYCTVWMTALLALAGLSEGVAEPVSSRSVLLGYGQSIPWLGETTERVRTLDLAYRHRRVLRERGGKGWYTGNHEIWMELPVSFILANRYDRDVHTVGMAGMDFMFAWVFAGWPHGQPYVTLGGGARYIAADIEGMGSRTPGDYQCGVGYRFAGPGRTTLTTDVRYIHISNLNLASPNVPLNSVAGYVGLEF